MRSSVLLGASAVALGATVYFWLRRRPIDGITVKTLDTKGAVGVAAAAHVAAEINQIVRAQGATPSTTTQHSPIHPFAHTSTHLPSPAPAVSSYESQAIPIPAHTC